MKKTKTPSKSLRSYCSTWWRNILILVIWKFESFNQSVATSWVPIMCALVQGRVSFLLTPFYEIWQWQFSKVIEFRFKSCFLHYWLSTSGKFLKLSTPRFLICKKGWHPCSAGRCLYNTDLGYGNPTVCIAVIVCGLLLTLVHVALCTFILLIPNPGAQTTFLGR